MSKTLLNKDAAFERLTALKAATGSHTVSCRTCTSSSEDWDGEPGATIYCGMTCSQRDQAHLDTYLEDQGIEVDAEHPCWVPDFWTTKFAALLDGTDEADARATQLYREAVMTHKMQLPTLPPLPTAARDLLRRAAESLQEYTAEYVGDMNNALAMEIEAYLAKTP